MNKKQKQLQYYRNYGGMLETELLMEQILGHQSIETLDESFIDQLLIIFMQHDEYEIAEKLQDILDTKVLNTKILDTKQTYHPLDKK